MKDTIIHFIIISISIIFLLIVSVLIVTRSAFFDFFVLSNSEALIGNAIGGIGTVVIGMANVIVLYFAFKTQKEANTLLDSQTNQVRNEFAQKTVLFNKRKESLDTHLKYYKEREDEKKDFSTYQFYSERLNDLYKTMNSFQIYYDGRDFIGLRDFGSWISQHGGELSAPTSCPTEIFFFYEEFYNLVLNIESVVKNDVFKKHLAQQANGILRLVLTPYHNSLVNIFANCAELDNNLNLASIILSRLT